MNNYANENGIENTVEPKEHEYEESGEEQYITLFQEELLKEESVEPSLQLLATLKDHPRTTLISLRDILTDVAEAAVSDEEKKRYENAAAAISELLQAPQKP